MNSFFGRTRTVREDSVRAALEKSLAEPLKDFYNRPRKEFRAQLVNIGFGLFSSAHPDAEAERALRMCGEAIEALHTGSLIVDDIEDQSEWRRGAPTLHLRYGLPTALNAGNWLYFYAFERLRQVELAGSDRKLLLYELTECILREAHCGQALDVGTDVSLLSPQHCIEICRASLELKSGALMGLALGLGAIVAGISKESLRTLVLRGIDFGVSLQMFDDLGNARVDRPTPKHLEDLKLRRPSFLWWHLCEAHSDRRDEFVLAVSDLPQTQRLAAFLHDTQLLQTGQQKALDFQAQALVRLAAELDLVESSYLQLQLIAERVSNAYT